MSVTTFHPLHEGCLSGCHWGGGSVCSYCGTRLRCCCGQFVREDSLELHFRMCPVLSRIPDEEDA
jgi:hypothetical protein